MKKILSLFFVGLLFLGCYNEPSYTPKRPAKPAGVLTKGTISKIEQVKGGYMLNVLIKNGRQYSSARGFVNTLNGFSSDGTNAVYEVGDLLLMQLKNGVIMYSEIAIKNFTMHDGKVIRSNFKRDKSRIKGSVPQENKIKF